MFGGVNPEHYEGEFTFIPLTNETYWMFRADGILVDNTIICKDVPAIADSGTSLIVGPTNLVNKIQDMIGADSLYIGQCQLLIDQVAILAVSRCVFPFAANRPRSEALLAGLAG